MDKDLLRKALQKVQGWADKKKPAVDNLPGMQSATKVVKAGVEKTKPYEPVIELDESDEFEEKQRKELYELRRKLRKLGVE